MTRQVLAKFLALHNFFYARLRLGLQTFYYGFGTLDNMVGYHVKAQSNIKRAMSGCLVSDSRSLVSS